MQRRPFSVQEVVFLTGAPLAWAVLHLFHPGGEGTEIYMDLRDHVTRMLVVHIGMVIFIPLMAVVIYVLLRGVEGTAARVSRIALVPYVLFYGAWEAVYGIGLGILGHEVNALPEAERAVGAMLIQNLPTTCSFADSAFSSPSEASHSSSPRSRPGSPFAEGPVRPSWSPSCSDSPGS